MKLLIDMSLSPLWVGFFALHRASAHSDIADLIGDR